jgi:peptide/nickel transport system substrate-binding protein
VRFLSCAAAAVLTSACLTLAGCTRGTAPHANVLRIADLAEPDRLNPLLSTMDLTEHLSALIYSTLVISDDKGRLIGDLAEAVPSLANNGISRDGKTIVYHLRPGITWHDGVPLTSHDVAFTWHVVMNPRNNIFHREGYDEVERIDTPDARTVVVHLRRRSPPFVTRFFTSLQEGAKAILPEHLLKEQATINEAPFNAAPVGSGPFRFVRWDRGRGIEMAAYDRYFRGRPKIDRIIFTVIPNENTMLDEARAHEIDVPQVSSGLYELYKSLPGMTTTLARWDSTSILALNDARPGLRHVEVRQAMARALDYQSMITKITHGVGTVARDVVPPSAIGYVANAAYPYDPIGARKLLEAHGWKVGTDGIRAKNGERLDFVYYIVTGSATGSSIAVLVQSWLRDIGIGVTLKSSPYNQIFSFEGPIQTGKYDLAAYSYTLPRDPDNLVYLGCDKFPNAGDNVFRYCDALVDAGERRGLTTDDPRARAAIYEPVERRIRETVPYIPIYEARRVVVHIDGLRHYTVSPSIAQWWNSWEWEFAR